MATFTAEQVAKHNTENDCWLIIDGQVYDVSRFLSEHPGGKKIVLKYAGKDATKEFKGLHKPEVLIQHSHLLKGKLASSAARASSSSSSANAAPQSAAPKSAAKGGSTTDSQFVPFSDPCVSNRNAEEKERFIYLFFF